MKLKTIAELFDRGGTVRWLGGNTAEFAVGEHRYAVMFMPQELGDYDGVEVNFGLYSPDTGGEFGITGTGNASAVLGMVLDVLGQYAERRRPAFLHFNAEEPSRVRLYKAMARRLARDWQLVVDDRAQPHLTTMFLVSKRVAPTQQDADQLYQQFRQQESGHDGLGGTLDNLFDDLFSQGEE